jgi:hypothetical protein
VKSDTSTRCLNDQREPSAVDGVAIETREEHGQGVDSNARIFSQRTIFTEAFASSLMALMIFVFKFSNLPEDQSIYPYSIAKVQREAIYPKQAIHKKLQENAGKLAFMTLSNVEHTKIMSICSFSSHSFESADRLVFQEKCSRCVFSSQASCSFLLVRLRPAHGAC